VRPVWLNSAAELMTNSKILSPQVTTSLAPGAQMFYLTGDESKYGKLLDSAPINVEKNTDYMFELPVKIEQGRVEISVTSVDDGALYASTIIETMEGKTPHEQPLTLLQIPFVSGRSGDHVQLVMANSASSVRPHLQAGTVKLFALGPASFIWTRLPRIIIQNLQKLFLTVFILPLVLFGLALLIRARQFRALTILLAIPVYYFCVQSALHTEYRYVLAIHYFLFILAAVALYWIGTTLRRRLRAFALTQKSL
jgi:hypothetical protein